MSGRKISQPMWVLCVTLLVGTGQQVWASEAHENHTEEAHHNADDGHASEHHLALVLGMAYEETADGHHEDGNVAGLEYVYHLNHHWGIGAAVEAEVFGDDQKRNAVIALPVSHFRGNWRLFAGPGVEVRRDDETEFIFRLGVGYSFHVNKRFSLSPEAMVDFVETGTNVYVLSLAFGLSL